MGRLVSFHLPADEPKALAEFYHKVFGWTYGEMPGMKDVYAIGTGPFDQPGLNGVIMGRFMPATVNTIEVEDIDATLALVTKKSGQITTPRQEIPGMGLFAWCKDIDDHFFVLMQPSADYQATITNALGGKLPADGECSRPIHFEIPAADMDKLAEFYTEVFGWTSSHWQGGIPYVFLMTGGESTGGADGAVMPKGEMQYVANTIGVADLKSLVDKVISAGGSILMPPEEIPGVGLFSYGIDPAGNIFGMMQFRGQ
jgi:predicted enzyme related to lactoylglutathione lyase